MRLIVKALRDERDRLHQNEVRLQVIGEFSTLPDDVSKELRDAMEVMRENCGLTLVLALSYSGRWDIIKANQRGMYDDIQTGVLRKEEITKKWSETYLSTKDIPDSGSADSDEQDELRISDFLLCSSIFELYF